MSINVAYVPSHLYHMIFELTKVCGIWINIAEYCSMHFYNKLFIKMQFECYESCMALMTLPFLP